MSGRGHFLGRKRSTSVARIYRPQRRDGPSDAVHFRKENAFGNTNSAESLNSHHRPRRDLLPPVFGLQDERAAVRDPLAAAGDEAGTGGDLERAAVEDAAAAEVGGLGEEAGTAELLPAAAKGGEQVREDAGYVEGPLE